MSAVEIGEPGPGALAPDTERGSARRVTTYDGTTTVVTGDEQAIAIRRTLYRDDENAVASIVPEFRPRLTSAEIDQFRDLGYFAMEGLLSAEEVASCLSALHDLAARRAELGDQIWVQEEPFFSQAGAAPVGGAALVGGAEPRVGAEAPADPQGGDPELRIRKFARFVKVEARLADAAAHPRVMAILEQLIGPGHRLVQDMALMKPPFKGSEKPWHQDNAYFDWTPLDGMLGVWIALDAATVENGCMQIIPGSHLAGPERHYHVRDCQLPDQRVAVDRIEVVPLKPGGVLFFSGLIHHGTPANMSASRRRALQFHYAAARCRRMTFREHMEYFSEGAFYTGCRDWDMEAGVSRAILEA